MKVRITKQRRHILDHMKNAHLVFDYTPQGNRLYFFTDGTAAKENVVESMIASGLLKFTESPLGGPGQEVVAA